jgi:integrase
MANAKEKEDFIKPLNREIKKQRINRGISPFSKPAINKSNPDQWVIYFNYVVPEILKNLYPEKYTRSTIRCRFIGNINSKTFTPEEREKNALHVLETLELALKAGFYNPFEKQLKAINEAYQIKSEFVAKKPLREEERRRNMSIQDVLDAFLESRKTRKVDPKTITSYKYIVDYLKKYIPSMAVGQVRYVHISSAVQKMIKFLEDKGKPWSAGTINKQWEFINTIFAWMTIEEYMQINPLKGKIVKLDSTTTIHKWYNRETAAIVKDRLIKEKKYPWLLRVCQFTYWILIRSKSELQNIRIGDIDFDLHQINFRKEWTKAKKDQNRDYSPEFQKVLDEMGLKNMPKDWYIFGKGGKPGPDKCGHNSFSNAWSEIRKELNLSEDYTIYGWKHTRIVHMMMLGFSSYEISHAARHSNTKTTEDYKKDYDISLTKIYSKEDLTF